MFSEGAETVIVMTVPIGNVSKLGGETTTFAPFVFRLSKNLSAAALTVWMVAFGSRLVRADSYAVISKDC